MTLKITNKTADAKKAFNAVSNQEGVKPEAVNEALEAYVTAIAEDAGKQVRDEYEELKNVTDNRVLEARGIPTLTAEETKFYNEAVKTGGFDSDVVWPETILERVFENLQKDHPILGIINFTPTVGRVKVIRARRTGVAVFGPLHKDLEGQLDAKFGASEFVQLALTAFFLISNDTLDLGPRWIDRFISLSLSEAVRDIWAEKVITGNGLDEPIGLLKNVDGALDETTGKPDKVSSGTLTFAKDKIVNELAGVMKKLSKFTYKVDKNDTGEIKYRKVSGNVYLIVNPVNYYDIIAAVTFANLNNVYGSNMPFINVENIIESIDVPENKLIAFVGGEYEATQSRPEKVYVYKETFAMKRATLYAIDMLGNGYPTNNDAANIYDLAFTADNSGE
ncbi:MULTISPECIES: phage major capsid protein [unclassified Enterococcus]|uniref:phage major capsid protein n=1 Tax=unclassified Enterococcus TaxID=2608891 RepID=UPI0015580645|nr:MULTISPECIES: phage major capsid protein [unclassified Enterococcus]MBS7578297.1 phage major capsid protein [Enterococcus sp. MMGLQ5-2]MBS7585492.1 phage major capsid protein [Enterococcus sp. MMGLQ5-1]NPD13349.1 phage major capsid protein [Enterococcus sp. MMGLQ5-1]NPD38128.1 phage major capsid protein [Enterococcus sp. MMGLQ5-2]